MEWLLLYVAHIFIMTQSAKHEQFDVPVKSLESLTRVLLVRYAVQFTQLRSAGTRIGANDLWIACHALADDCTLVTNKLREFQRVGLKLENWVED